MTNVSLEEIQSLYNRGFAIHWLKPKSKVPVASGWTKGKRLAWGSLKSSFKPSFNVGVRLGQASFVDEIGYLAVIDVDIKSDNPVHRREAEEAVLKIFPESKKAPKVLSGRGNGSAHFYVLTLSPLRGNEKKAQSSETVQVYMPSATPSQKEIDTLSEKQIEEGFRLRSAWEISFMSEGRQVVLPPSIHPDTGKEYEWEAIDGPELSLPLLKAETPKAAALLPKATALKTPIILKSFRDVELNSLGLREDQIASIVSGSGVSDRSAECYALSMALLQRGATDETILSLFTDRKYFLGKTAYDHAKTSSRIHAAQWFNEYCLKKAKEKVFEPAFDIEELKTLHPDSSEFKSQAYKSVSILQKLGLKAWHEKLDLQRKNQSSPFTLRNNAHNVQMILQNEFGKDFLKYDTFKENIFYNYDTPWGFKKGKQRSSGTEDALIIKPWFKEKYQMELSLSTIDEGIDMIAYLNPFHPVKQYLESLPEWDGIERIENAFKTYMGAAMPVEYQKAVSKKFFLAMMARIFEPGVKFDHIVVFEGPQGVGKSSFGRILVGDQWFLDGLPDLSDKDSVMNLQGMWLVEMAELAAINRSQLETTKAFVVRQVDKIRPPYGKRRVEMPRSNVFYGTTNSDEYLVDHTGNRRFWPIKVNRCDFKALKRDREQILAEALYTYKNFPEPLYLENGVAKEQAESIQESRRVLNEGDHMILVISEWLKLTPKQRPGRELNLEKGFRIFELFQGPLVGFEVNQYHLRHAGHALRKLGFIKTKSNGSNIWRVGDRTGDRSGTVLVPEKKAQNKG